MRNSFVVLVAVVLFIVGATAMEVGGNRCQKTATSRHTCELISTCQWCDGKCVALSEGVCCSTGDTACSNPATYFCNSSQTCDVVNLNAGTGLGNCTYAKCCPNEKPSVCATVINGETCYNKNEQKCCPGRSDVIALDGNCCNASAYAGAGACPKGKSCCGDNRGGTLPVICCDSDAEVCHTTEYGNFCTKKNLPGICNANIPKETCLQVVNSSSGDLACEWCGGECTPKSDGVCCTNHQDFCYNPFSAICGKNEVCSSYQTVVYSKSCSYTRCCPKETPSLCKGYGNGGTCYNENENKCCQNGGDSSVVVPKNANCCGGGSGGEVYCVNNGTCCGQWPTICCGKGQKCDINVYPAKCVAGV